MFSAIYIELSILDLLSEEQEIFICILTLIGQATPLTANGNQKVWLQNNGESEVREAKSSSCFTIVY